MTRRETLAALGALAIPAKVATATPAPTIYGDAEDGASAAFQLNFVNYAINSAGAPKPESTWFGSSSIMQLADSLGRSVLSLQFIIAVPPAQAAHLQEIMARFPAALEEFEKSRQ